MAYCKFATIGVKIPSHNQDASKHEEVTSRARTNCRTL